MKILKIILILNFIISKKYYIGLKNRQDLNIDTSYGVLGGTIGSFLELTNQFMITFWFNYVSNTNDKFPFITIFNNTFPLKEYIFYNNVSPKNIFAYDDTTQKINFTLNTIYFLKLEFILFPDYANIKLTIFQNNNTNSTINNNIPTTTNIDNYIFMINRLNLSENILIENLIYYDSVNDYNNEELLRGVSKELFFINFRHNYPYTKWIMNEINNEFGPCLNGNNNYYNNKVINAIFDDNNQEIVWESSNLNGEILFNDSLKKYMGRFEYNNSFNIYFKFDIFINYLNNSLIENKTFNLKLLYFFQFKLVIFHSINNTNFDIEKRFHLYDKLDNSSLILGKTIPGNTIINDKKFFEGNYIGLKYIIFNFYRNSFEGNNYKLISYLMFEKNSIFCNNNECSFKNNFQNLQHDNLDNGTIKINLMETDYNRELAFIFKEFILGLGNLTANFENITNNELLIESNEINNLFIICNNSIKDLERRNTFNQNKEHSKCTDLNCSICRTNLSTCEYCYKNYYLNMNTCTLNNDNTKFVNNYSLWKTIDNSITSYQTENNSSNFNYYFSLSLTPFTGYFLFNIKIHLENNYLDNVINRIFSNICPNEFSIFLSKWNFTSGDLNIVLPLNNNNCFNKIYIWSYKEIYVNTNSLINFKFEINKENINCSKQFKDIICSYGCSRNSSYYIEFDSTLYYGTCKNSSINYLVKNTGNFKYYYNCPFNCATCSNNWGLINCLTCENGYSLKNNECILNIIVDCNSNPSFNLSQNHSNILFYNCTNICNHIGSASSGKKNIIRYYKINNKICGNEDILVGSSLNTSNYFNYKTNLWVSCSANCLNFNCSNCNDTTFFSPCSTNYKLFDINKCILDSNFNINCINYIKNPNYICNTCSSGKFLSGTNTCDDCNSNCVTCSNTATNCLYCSSGKFLSGTNTCDDCNSNCVTCSNTATNCLSCSSGRFLSGTNTCDDCNSNCVTCSNTATNCLTCSSGKFLSGTNTCDDCNSNCVTCSNTATNCLSCSLGRFLSGTNTCDNCDSNCLTCTNIATNCLSCSSGRFLSGTNTCDDCNSNCVTCSNTATNCLTCSSGKFLSGTNTCDDCDSNCLTCTNTATNCLTCSSGKFLSGTNTCDSCDSNCLTCTNTATNCLTCSNNHFFSNNNCFLLNNLNCISFQNHNNSCLICENNYYLNPQNMCLKRSTLNCLEYINNKIYCKKCLEGYFLENNKCIRCLNNCIICEDNNKCLKCDIDYYWDLNNKCALRNTKFCLIYKKDTSICDKCIDGYFLKYSICNICSNFCKKCIHEVNHCIECYDQFIIKYNRCLPDKIKNCITFNQSNYCINCKEGYYLNNRYTCEKCNKNCLICQNFSKLCLKCNSNYYLKKGLCYKYPNYCNDIDESNIKNCKICKNGYILNYNFQCIKCNDNCLNCENNLNNCTKCKNNEKPIKLKTNDNYCPHDCNKTQYFQVNNRKCIDCKIYEYYDFKLYNNKTINNTKLNNYNFKKKLLNEKYFIILSIPEFINKEAIIKKDIEDNITIKIKNLKINYFLEINENFNKILILPYFNIFKYDLIIDLIIFPDIFNKYKNCKFNKTIINFSLKNFNITNYKDELLTKANENYKLYDENSKEYSIIKWISTISNYLIFILFSVLSIVVIFKKDKIGNIAQNFSYLLFFINFNYLMKENNFKFINTLLYFLNYNFYYFDINKIFNFDNNTIRVLLVDFVLEINKLIRFELIKVNNLSILYLFLLIVIFVFIIINGCIYLINLFKKLKIKKKSKKIFASTKNTEMTLHSTIKTLNKTHKILKMNKNYLKNMNNNEFNLWIKFLKIMIKINNFLNYLIIYWIIINLPNFLLVTLFKINFLNLHFNSLNIFNFMMILLNYCIFICFIYYYKKIYSIYYYNNYKNIWIDSDLLQKLKFFMPTIPLQKNNLIFYKLFDIVRIFITYIICIFFSNYPNTQILILLLIQLFILIFLINLPIKEFLYKLLKLKELVLLIYYFSFIIYKINEELKNAFEIIISSIFVFFIVLIYFELLLFLFNEIFIYLKNTFGYWKNFKKKRNFNKIKDIKMIN